MNPHLLPGSCALRPGQRPDSPLPQRRLVAQTQALPCHSTRILSSLPKEQGVIPVPKDGVWEASITV